MSVSTTRTMSDIITSTKVKPLFLLVLVIIVSALMGFLTALFFELFIQIKLRYRLYKMGRQIKQQDEEIQRLKKEIGVAVPTSAKPPVNETKPADEMQSGI